MKQNRPPTLPTSIAPMDHAHPVLRPADVVQVAATTIAVAVVLAGVVVVVPAVAAADARSVSAGKRAVFNAARFFHSRVFLLVSHPLHPSA